MAEREIVICRDLEELNRKAAEQFMALAGESISRNGQFTVALSGGSTPKGLYALLATPEYRDRVDWSRVHLFWGDERCVPSDHAESNFRMVHETLLSKITIEPRNLHRMAGEKEPEIAAREYEDELRRWFRLAPDEWPRFDLILLGLGEDGHTASLFPDTAALNEEEHLVSTVYVERLKAHRLTLTLPVINAAARIIFLVAGESKRSVVKDLLRADSRSQGYPAAQVKPESGKVTWLIAQDAARELST